jgi:hypothetical protein
MIKGGRCSASPFIKSDNMPYLDKDFKPTLYEYTNVNDYNRLLVYYPRKGGRGVPSCDFTYEILVTPTPTPTSSITPTPSITPSITPTPTPSSSAPAFDVDAAAYLATIAISGGTTDPTIDSAVNTLFTELKSNGLYSKMLAMYPFVGATAASHSINALLNSSYNITWFGGMTHGISGSTGNGTNGYGIPNILTSNFTSSSNYSMGFYQNTENTPLCGEEVSMGILLGSSNFQIASNVNSTKWFMRSNSGTGTELANSGNIDGNYILNRTGTTYTSLSRNNSVILSNTSSPNALQVNHKIYLFNFNFGNAPYGNGFANQTYCFAFFGEGFSNSEITTLDSIINTFQTSLGRNTY